MIHLLKVRKDIKNSSTLYRDYADKLKNNYYNEKCKEIEFLEATHNPLLYKKTEPEEK